MITIEQLQQVTTKDLEAINALQCQLSSSAQPMTYARLLEMLKENHPVIVARDGARIIAIGMIVIYNVPTEKRAWLEEIIVDEQYRGQGLGEKISKELIEIARREHVARVYLSSNPTRTAARKLYEKLGFEAKDTQVYKLKL